MRLHYAFDNGADIRQKGDERDCHSNGTEEFFGNIAQGFVLISVVRRRLFEYYSIYIMCG